MLRRVLAAVLAALAAAATVAVAFAAPPPVPREAARPAALTWDIMDIAWQECARAYEFELGTSTSVFFRGEGQRLVVNVSGSPADGPLEAALQSCLDRYRFDDDGGGVYAPFTPFEQLIVAAYRESVVENCLLARGVVIPPLESWQLDVGMGGALNPYFGMSGDAQEIAELRRACPPYPGFLVPDTPVR